ncbi:MAG: hypothetical protein ACXIT4_09130 [Erythrobacter sp.]
MRALAALAALAGIIAAPLQAFDEAQENCVGSETPSGLHDDLTDHFLADMAEEEGVQTQNSLPLITFEARVSQCAIETGVPDDRLEAYGRFAFANSLRRTSQARLDEGGYRTDLLDAGLEMLVMAVGDPRGVFSPDQGLSDEGFIFLEAFFDEADEEFMPQDPVRLLLLVTYVSALAQIVDVLEAM